MKMLKVMATKPHKYGTRQLTAGDEYELPIREAVALVAGRKARFAKDKRPRAAMVEQQLVSESDDSIAGAAPSAQAGHGVGAMTSDAAIDRLRAEAEQIGLVVDRRWGLARLQHEIAQAKR